MVFQKELDGIPQSKAFQMASEQIPLNKASQTGVSASQKIWVQLPQNMVFQKGWDEILQSEVLQMTWVRILLNMVSLRVEVGKT